MARVTVEDAVDKMYQSSGMPVMLRKKSTIPNKMIVDWNLEPNNFWKKIISNLEENVKM